jgi:capsular exopolysaccharide synthesis family protein
MLRRRGGADPEKAVGAGMDNEAEASDSGWADPTAALRVLSRRRRLALGFAACVIGAVSLYTLRQPKVYEVAASVIIDANPPRFLDSQVQEVVETGAGTYWYNKEYYETQYKVIVSRAVSERVVEKLGLAHDASFLGLDEIRDPEKRRKAIEAADAPAMLQAKIRVQPVKDSRLVFITLQDVDPERGALLANEVANAYIAENLALKLRMTGSATQWLEDRLESLATQARTSEVAVYEFKKNQDMLTTSLEDRQSMVSQRLTTTNQALTDVKTRIAGLRARVQAMEALRKSTLDGADGVHWAESLAGNSQLIEALKVRYATLHGECAELTERYLPEHPRLLACTDKLKAARVDLERELNNVVVAAQNELQEALAKEKNLGSLLEATKGEAFEVNKKQIAFDRLKRDADTNQRLYDLVLKRLKEIELSGLLRTSNVRVLDAARPTRVPVKPNVKLNLALALLLGLLGGSALAFAVELLDTSVSTQEQVEQWLGVTFLGILPSFGRSKDGTHQDLVVFQQPKSAAAECARAIRTNLLFMSPDRPLKTMLVTSSGPQDGKTTTAISVAISMAESGSKVLLVDADMRRPRIHRAFNLANGVGLSTLILGNGKLSEAVRSTDVPNLFVLTCGPVPPNPAELLHTEAFANLLKEMSVSFDRVVVDSPPVAAVSDAVVMSTHTDGTLMVLKAGRTSRELARRSLRALRDVNARVFGAVLNDLDLEARQYRGYYHYERAGYYAEKPERVAS